MGQRYDQLSAEERGAIQAFLQGGDTPGAIAVKLQRARSTIKREIHRNGIRPPGRPWGRPPVDYAAKQASARARQRRHRARRERKLREESVLWQAVQAQLCEGWSPQQIARTLRQESSLSLLLVIPANAGIQPFSLARHSSERWNPAFDLPLSRWRARCLSLY